MIEIVESFSSPLRQLRIFNYNPLTYTYTVSTGTISGDTVSVPDSTSSVTITFTYSDSTTEDFTYVLKTRSKVYSFDISYSVSSDRVSFYLNGLYRSSFHGWATAGATDFSMASKLFFPMIYQSYSKMFTSILLKIEEKDLSIFPISKDSIIRNRDKNGLSHSTFAMIPFSHISNFEEVALEEKLLKTGYATAPEAMISPNGRTEKYTSNHGEGNIFSSLIKFTNNNTVNKKANGLINSILSPDLIRKGGGYKRVTNDTNTISIIEGDNVISRWYSPVTIEKIVMSIFADVFILSSNNKIYYSKLEIDTPSYENLNPSINNNNIVEIDGDYFCPGDDIEIVVDFEYLRDLSAKEIIVKVSNNNGTFYIIDDDTVSNIETSIEVKERKNMSIVTTTDSEDRYILVEVFVDGNEVPYLAYSAATLLDVTQISESDYLDMYAYDNRLIGKKIISTALTVTITDDVIISGTYMATAMEDSNYVSIRT